MISIRRTALSLSIAALFAVPSVAQADVGAQTSKASKALDRAVTAAKHGNDGAFKRSARAHRRAIRAASRSARHIRGTAKRAKALRRVAAASDRSVDRFAAVLDLVPADLQGLVVGNLDFSADIRAQVVDMLLALAEQLPEPARTQVIDAITQFQTDGEIGALFQALASEDVLNGVKDMIQAQIEALSAQLDSVLSHFEELAGVLPPGAGEALTGAISIIEGHLAHIGDLIGNLFDQIGGGGLFGGGGILGGFGGGAFCDLLGSFPLPIPICD